MERYNKNNSDELIRKVEDIQTEKDFERKNEGNKRRNNVKRVHKRGTRYVSEEDLSHEEIVEMCLYRLCDFLDLQASEQSKIRKEAKKNRNELKQLWGTLYSIDTSLNLMNLIKLYELKIIDEDDLLDKLPDDYITYFDGEETFLW